MSYGAFYKSVVASRSTLALNNRRGRFSDVFTRLDFVRPLDERIPSDEEEEKEEKEERTSRRIAAKTSARPHERAMDVEKAGGSRGGCGSVRGERGGRGNRSRGRDRGRGKDRGRPVAEEGETLVTDEKSPKRQAAGCTGATVGVATSEREARGVGRRSKLGDTATGKSMKPPQKGVRRGVLGKRRRGKEAVASEGGGDKSVEEEEEKEGEEEGDEALPFVSSLEELREFVRLEGSIVGHGKCLWADSFAFHVISRRLGITILFVDMVSYVSVSVGTVLYKIRIKG